MENIKIEKTTKCDTRALDKTFTEKDVLDDTLKHIKAVRESCRLIAEELIIQSSKHDHTKIEYLDAFTYCLRTGFTGDKFKGLDWWDIHINKERHHLNDKCPEDVNLIDVIEMLCDCVCAGKARTGTVYPIEISNEILQKAVANTVNLLMNHIEVKE